MLDNLMRPAASLPSKCCADIFISPSPSALRDKMRANNLQEFFPERYARRLASSHDIHQIFDLVRDAVKEQVGVVRTGLDLGMAELEDQAGKVPLALHPMGCNLLVINRRAVELAGKEAPEHLRAMLFHSLLYEYLQTIGFVPELEIKGRALEISIALFGRDHLVTKMAEDLEGVLPGTTHSKRMALPAGTEVRSANQLALDD
jgi:hypothetical protein